MSTWPDATALDNGVQQLAYAELSEAVEELADELVSRGIGRGDRVGVPLPSGTVDLYVAFGCPAHRGGVRPRGRR